MTTACQFPELGKTTLKKGRESIHAYLLPVYQARDDNSGIVSVWFLHKGVTKNKGMNAGKLPAGHGLHSYAF